MSPCRNQLANYGRTTKRGRPSTHPAAALMASAMSDAPESPATICCPDPASVTGAPQMQKINLDLVDAAEPRGFEQLSPATPSEGPRSLKAWERDIMRYNMVVCALLVLLPPVLAFGALELVRMLDEQTEASLRSVTTVRHDAPAATRVVIEPTMEEVRPATLMQPHALAAGLVWRPLSTHANPAQEQGMFALFVPFVTLVLLTELGIFVLFRALEG